MSDDDLRALSDAATPGPWFWNSYNAIFSAPLVEEYNRLEALIPKDATDDDPRWDALPETIVAGGPSSGHGDLATKAGANDLPFIAAAVNYVRDRLAASPGARHDVPDLDEAWAAAEAALPEGSITVTFSAPFRDGSRSPVHVEARTSRPTAGRRGPRWFHWHAEGPDLTEALRNLAAMLRPSVLVPHDEPTREDIEG